MIVRLTQKEFQEKYPEAFAALPEVYKADNCLDFGCLKNDLYDGLRHRLYQEGQLFAWGKEDQRSAVSDMIWKYNPDNIDYPWTGAFIFGSVRANELGIE